MMKKTNTLTNRLWYRFRNIAFNCIFVVWTAILGILFLPLLIILPPNLVVELRRPWVSFLMFCLRVMFNVKYKFRGLENLKRHKNFIVAAKHHSTLDVFLLSHILDKPAFILKRSLLYAPILGLYLIASRMIPVDDSIEKRKTNGIDVLRRMLKDARARMQEGRVIVIYPEGERTRIGAKVSYKRGVLALHKNLKVPVVPVSLNAGMIWPLEYFGDKNSGTVTVDILDPIECGLPDQEFLERLENNIEEKTDELISKTLETV